MAFDGTDPIRQKPDSWDDIGRAELVSQVREHLDSLHDLLQRIDALPDVRPHDPGPEPLPPAYNLTPREDQVLAILLTGHSNRQIARRLAISEPTVKNHLHAVFLKLGVTDRTQAVAKVLGERREPQA